MNSEFFSKVLKYSAIFANFNIYSFLKEKYFSLGSFFISSFSFFFGGLILPNILLTSKVDLPNLFIDESFERICKFRSLKFENIILFGSVILLLISDIFILFM